MTDMIILDYHPFDQSSIVTVIKDGERSEIPTYSITTTLSQTLVRLAHEKNINHLFIHAPTLFFNEMNQLIQEEEHNLYSENTIITEIC